MNPIRAWFLRLLFGSDPYPPEAAEAPDPVAEVHDEYERAKYFTGEETQPFVTCAAHLKVCGMNDTQVAAELAKLASGSLSDLWSAPARLAEYYVAPESDR